MGKKRIKTALPNAHRPFRGFLKVLGFSVSLFVLLYIIFPQIWVNLFGFPLYERYADTHCTITFECTTGYFVLFVLSLLLLIRSRYYSQIMPTRFHRAVYIFLLVLFTIAFFASFSPSLSYSIANGDLLFVLILMASTLPFSLLFLFLSSSVDLLVDGSGILYVLIINLGIILMIHNWLKKKCTYSGYIIAAIYALTVIFAVLYILANPGGLGA